MAQVVFEDPIHHISGKSRRSTALATTIASAPTESTPPYTATEPLQFQLLSVLGATCSLKSAQQLATA